MRRAIAMLVLLGASPVAWAGEGTPGERARAATALSAARPDADRFAQATWAAPELARNRFGDAGRARVAVRVPRREAECLSRQAKCWLVLYLPGFDSSADSIRSFAPELAALDARPDAPPIVLVALDGRTRLGGGWYVDSPASGEWESLTMKVLLPAARDALAPGTPASRTLVIGHSMGGFGAIHLVEAHPDSFAGFAAFNPAADLSRIGEQLIRSLEAHGELPDGAALVDGSGTHFDARLLVTLDAALDPDPKAPHDLASLVIHDRKPWRLSPGVRKALEEFDETRHPPRARGLVFAGSNDHLIPPAALEPLRSRSVELIVTDGNHVSHLAPDLERALETLVR